MTIALHLQKSSFLIGHCILRSGTLTRHGCLFPGNTLFHPELHQCPEQDTEIDLNRDSNDGILQRLDVRQVHVCEDLESPVAGRRGDHDACEQQQTHQPVLASVLGKLPGSDGTAIHVDQGLSCVVDVGHQADADAHRQQHHVEFLEDLDEFLSPAWVLGIGGGQGQPPL